MSSTKIVTFRAEINKVTTMATWTRLILDAQELPPEEMAILFGLKSKGNTLVAIQEKEFKSDFQFKDIPEVENDQQKSPSQRQRGLIYVLWEKMGKPDGNFEVFYMNEMERIAEYLKVKISKYD